ncbi:hypothetical protein CJF32_00008236 [Rutstroemia sp. NJR-2017a WRK4]|nr:hypothetical protein CJF32_00008236 [Rutstroemia sp. NJR-2017a WRK4]
MDRPRTAEGSYMWSQFVNNRALCRHRKTSNPDFLSACSCWSDHICRQLDKAQRDLAAPPSSDRQYRELQEELDAARSRTLTHAEQENKLRDDRDRHINRLVDIQAQINDCITEIDGSITKTVSVEEFISIVRRALYELKLTITVQERSQQEIDACREDMKQFYQLVAEAAKEIDSVRMIKALQQEIRQQEVSNEFVQYLHERNREGARVISQLSQEQRDGWEGRSPRDQSIITSSVGSVGGKILAAPITYDTFKAFIWDIYLGLFDSERTLRLIFIDRNMEVPIWSSPPSRQTSENIAAKDRWSLSAQLVTKEVDRFYFRVLQLWQQIRNNRIPGSQDEWNGPYDDDNGRAYKVHEAVKAARGRGFLAEQELKLKRQFLDQITYMGRKTDLDERHDRRFPIYLKLQDSIWKITQRIEMFRQPPPDWPEQHERDNTAMEPKRDYELLALMLTRIEMEYLSLRLKQLLETAKSYWHLIPHGDATMASEMAEELSQATAARVACEAELTRPSEIAPAPAYPGKTLPPYDEYIPYGKQFEPWNNSSGGKNEQGGKGDNNKGQGQGSNNKLDGMKKQNLSLRARMKQMQDLLKKQKVQYKHKQFTGNFAGMKNGASEWDKFTAENKLLTTYKNELEGAWKKANDGKKPPAWPKN